ncbi:hypothetical protein KC315_g1389 [Hortaea werneckii]|nr:hypothetical protein KC342_g8004 [Hortaea werneckii]KAI6878105.1 hypothetical protein KC334_g17378 [Hortaea werneckii]KAI7096530.1 hypothetical protein KC339_g10307 [Hortaea werneckii]KAI7160945.1 hypothetical protein KC349_g3146 [Hortaea werneckii]KAI7232033.1 hypothetical protein KC330_g6085 [Hortaea werneckii]
MASKGQLKDMRRDDLIVPYAEPEKDKENNDMQSTMASTLPMAAMFTRNKLIGWTAVLFSIQGWLSETPDQRANASTPGYFSVGMALLSLGVAYMPLFLPPQSAKAGANLKSFDPFAEAEDNQPDTKKGAQDYIHIRIQQRNGRKTLTTVQGLPKKFDQKKILKVIKKKFACNGTIVNDTEMGEVIQLQGDQRKDVQEFLVDKKEGLELDAKTIKVHGF